MKARLHDLRPVAVLILLFSLGGALPNPAFAQLKGANPVMLLGQGAAAVDQKDYAKGLELFNQLLASDPHHGLGHYYVGVCHANLGAAEKAVKHLDLAIANGHDISKNLRSDPYLSEPLKNPAFVAGVDKILSRLERRGRGIVTGLPFGFRLQNWESREYKLEDYRGKSLALAFLDSGKGSSVEVGLILEQLAKADPELEAVAVVKVLGKTIEKQVNALESYGSSTRLSIPLLLHDRETLKQLRPFREFPTVLFFDRDGLPRRIVEGHDHRVLELYEKALAETRAEGAAARAKDVKKGSSPKSGKEAKTRPSGKAG